jgi:hypothetical protein
MEISRMTTVAKADKSRLTIRGLKKHRRKKTGMSVDTFANLYHSRSPLGADTAKEIAANIAATDRAK